MSDDNGELVEGSGGGEAPMGGQIRGAAMDAREMIAEIRETRARVDAILEIVHEVMRRVKDEGIEIHIVRVSDKKVLDVIGEGKIGDSFPFGGNIRFGKSKPTETQE